ncbi:putative nucleotidyltransferase substrate binding domain-containing protein [Aquisalimonas lutea]|uniref:putative nucleotidyltransferase substrate binding domain-containing protein n=1 Tax=Aquisalimonas lutea TaxID=1327750 RepID=UPI0025B49DB6|nr:putative nucleotidyltransferase substrate binding domain-containing protein [Aquisalimonas lutea]MDN3518174.1 putative nucleotidyltransferase substrate binding domain-containing protein [Aquisalimonas lutea]
MTRPGVLFDKTVADVMQPARVVCSPDTSCEELARRMALEEAPCALVVDSTQRLRGLILSRDILRHFGIPRTRASPVEPLITAPGYRAHPDHPVSRALGALQRAACRYAPVLDADGTILGLLDRQDCLHTALPSVIPYLGELATADTNPGLAAARRAQADIAGALRRDGAGIHETQAVLSRLNDDVHRRALAMATAAMERDGWGTPPRPYSLFLMGSAGRLGSFLDPDQDNGLVIADYPDREHAAIDGYFSELARRLCSSLNQAGIVFCPGHVMATNPLWRKTVTQWREQIGLWLRRRSDTGFLHCSILLDCRHAAGDAAMADELRSEMFLRLEAAPGYLRSLTLADSPRDVGLGWFNRLITEPGDSPHAGAMDLKRYGITPIVEVARLYALAHGVEAVSTPGRLGALSDAGVLPRREADDLIGAHAYLAGMLLDHQLEQLQAGEAPAKYLEPARLEAAERDRLVDSLKITRSMVRKLARDLVGIAY